MTDHLGIGIGIVGGNFQLSTFVLECESKFLSTARIVLNADDVIAEIGG